MEISGRGRPGARTAVRGRVRRRQGFVQTRRAQQPADQGRCHVHRWGHGQHLPGRPGLQSGQVPGRTRFVRRRQWHPQSGQGAGREHLPPRRWHHLHGRTQALGSHASLRPSPVWGHPRRRAHARHRTADGRTFRAGHRIGQDRGLERPHGRI